MFVFINFIFIISFMRKVRVQIFDTDLYGYTFYLRGEKQKFTSQRNMNQFVNLLNKKLTDNVNLLNQIYIELYVKYREYYFIMSVFEHGMLKNQFLSIETYIDNMIKRTKSVNGLHIAINNLDNSIHTFSEILSVFEKSAKKRSDTSFIYYLKSKSEFITFFESQVLEMKIRKEHKNTLKTEKNLKHVNS